MKTDDVCDAAPAGLRGERKSGPSLRGERESGPSLRGERESGSSLRGESESGPSLRGECLTTKALSLCERKYERVRD